MLNKFKRIFHPSVVNQAPTVDQFVTLEFQHQGQLFQLRRLRSADLDRLLAIERDVYDGQMPWNRLVFLNEVNKRERHLYVGLLTPNQELVGFIGAWYNALELHITNVAVMKAWQDQGLGKQLMLFMINQAKRAQCATVTLEAKVSNAQAKHLYHQLGFIDRKIKKNYYVADHEDAVSMALLLRD